MINTYNLKKVRDLANNKRMVLEDLRAETQDSNDAAVKEHRAKVKTCTEFLVSNLDDLNSEVKKELLIKYSFKKYSVFRAESGCYFGAWLRTLRNNARVKRKINKGSVTSTLVEAMTFSEKRLRGDESHNRKSYLNSFEIKALEAVKGYCKKHEVEFCSPLNRESIMVGNLPIGNIENDIKKLEMLIEKLSVIHQDEVVTDLFPELEVVFIEKEYSCPAYRISVK